MTSSSFADGCWRAPTTWMGSSGASVTGRYTASQRRRNTLEDFEGFQLKATARIWPLLACARHIRLTALRGWVAHLTSAALVLAGQNLKGFRDLHLNPGPDSGPGLLFFANVVFLSRRMNLSVTSRKSTPPQDSQLIDYYYQLQYRVDHFGGG